ncbi:HAD-IIA family hydrolase [Sediminivirga luteola]|uniref:HAD-IIA family hydrolase n=1 Tax=Sediminivirga luteola TaxID=1774748 RepID=UPI001F562C91|nr:HAD-IIA family hydrolase [Sediminivirga luteola]MCI2267024.1 HAD-IIA family hydrolase [Sediminivirga luteola]
MDRSHITSWLTDMDGVLVRENHALPGAAELLEQWRREDAPYLVLTNNSIFTARDLSARLRASGLVVPEERIWTSALATADFLARQSPGASAFVVGEAGITTALHEAGFIMTESDPEYVVVGETRNYSFEAITKAIRLILGGSRFIATNPDATGPSQDGVLPATGAITALITKATGRHPYVVGKPNPMMFRSALNRIGAHSETTAMIGDRMDTDVIAGIEAGLHTILVLTGISDDSEIAKYPFRPSEIISGVHELVRPSSGDAHESGAAGTQDRPADPSVSGSSDGSPEDIPAEEPGAPR